MNAAWPAISFFGNHLICPLRIIFIVLIPSKPSPCRVKRSESLACSDPPFDRPVVLLDDVVEVTDRSA